MLIDTLFKAAVGLIIGLIIACWCDLQIVVPLTTTTDSWIMCPVLLHPRCCYAVCVHSKKENVFQPKYFIAFMKNCIRCLFYCIWEVFYRFLVVLDFTIYSNTFFTVSVFLMTPTHVHLFWNHLFSFKLKLLYFDHYLGEMQYLCTDPFVYHNVHE